MSWKMQSPTRTRIGRRARLAVGATVALVAAAPAAADLGQRQHDVQSQLSGVQSKIAAAHAREAALQAEISSVTIRMRGLEARAGDVSAKLGTLQADLALHQRREHAIDELYAVQTRQLTFLRQQGRVANRRLSDRLVQIYESGEEPSAIEVILGAKNLDDALSALSYSQQIASEDKQIAATVAHARRELATARARTAKLRASLSAETRVVSYRVQQVAQAKQALDAADSQLAHARSTKQQALAQTQANERDWIAEANSLRSQSEALQAQIAAAQSAAAAPPTSANPATPPSSPSSQSTTSSGLIWPVSGPITSPFGMRWGSLHPGIDIGVPMGTPIHAAASGRVLVASYDGGYGNLVVLDNGGGISTAYAHQSQIAVSVGQQVAQGEVIGYVGSTGFSTGPHLHFEVRVNGSPVDPMGYL